MQFDAELLSRCNVCLQRVGFGLHCAGGFRFTQFEPRLAQPGISHSQPRVEPQTLVERTSGMNPVIGLRKREAPVIALLRCGRRCANLLMRIANSGPGRRRGLEESVRYYRRILRGNTAVIVRLRRTGLSRLAQGCEDAEKESESCATDIMNHRENRITRLFDVLVSIDRSA